MHGRILTELHVPGLDDTYDIVKVMGSGNDDLEIL